MRKAILLLLCFIFVTPVRAADSAKPPVVITAPAKLEHRNDWIYLIVSDSKHSYEIAWDEEVALQTNQVYVFTIIEEPFMRNAFLPRVTKVQQDGKTIYDREMCEIRR